MKHTMVTPVLSQTFVAEHHRSLNSDPEEGGRAPAAGQGQSGEHVWQDGGHGHFCPSHRKSGEGKGSRAGI